MVSIHACNLWLYLSTFMLKVFHLLWTKRAGNGNLYCFYVRRVVQYKHPWCSFNTTGERSPVLNNHYRTTFQVYRWVLLVRIPVFPLVPVFAWPLVTFSPGPQFLFCLPFAFISHGLWFYSFIIIIIILYL